MKTWGFTRYNKMVEIWDLHGPPPFVTLAAAHLDPKKKKRRSKPSAPDATTKPTKSKRVKDAPPEDGTGTMADLAAFMGVGGKKKKVTF